MNRNKEKGWYVRQSFTEDFVDFLVNMYDKYGEEVFSVHGISNKYCDIANFSKNFFSKSNVADISVDANANIKSKNIIQYDYENNKAINKLNNLYRLYKSIKKTFSTADAQLCIEKIISGELFINDLSSYKPYCFAFDLRELEANGMNFYSEFKIKRPKTAQTFINLMVQTTAFLSNQLAGAVSYPSFFPTFDKYLRHDFGDDYIKNWDKNYNAIENMFQNFIYSMNYNFRGAQCVDQETEVLTPDGFKKYNELNVNDDIYTWNNGNIRIQKVDKVNIADYNGEMHIYEGRDVIQQVTPNHRVLFRNNNKEMDIKYSYEIFDKKTPIDIPIIGKNLNDEYDMSDDLLKLVTIALTVGSLVKEENKLTRIRITKSEKRSKLFDIDKLLNDLQLTYTKKEAISKFSGLYNEESKYHKNEYVIYKYTINSNDSQKILDLINHTKEDLPKWFNKLSQRQAKIVIDTWSLFDGNASNNKIKLQCDNEIIQDKLQQLAFLSGYGSKKTNRLIGTNKKETKYITLYNKTIKTASKKYKVNYNGKVWCPTTEDGVVVFRKNGKLFISGNSAFTNLSILDRGFLKSLFDGYTFYDGTEPDLESSYELSKRFYEYFNRVYLKENPFTFPVLTLACSLDENTNEYLDPEFVDWVAKEASQLAIGNVFQDIPTSFSSCCRLKNDFKGLEQNGVQNSFGVGGLSIGSIRVAGLNLPRLALLEKENPDILLEDLECLRKIHHAFRLIIDKQIEGGFLPLYTHNWIHTAKQYSTIGLIGAYEYVKNWGLDIKESEGQEKLLNVLSTIENKIKSWQATYRGQGKVYTFNVEQIPGESFAIRCAEIDKLLGYNKDKNLLYSNQYLPLIENSSIYDRIKLQGIFDSKTSGGAILHLNVDDEKPVSEEQFKKLMNTNRLLKSKYFAINYCYSQDSEGNLIIGKYDVNPTNGLPIVQQYSRVVGFITPIKAWNKVRREYEFPNRVFYKNNEIESL